MVGREKKEEFLRWSRATAACALLLLSLGSPRAQGGEIIAPQPSTSVSASAEADALVAEALASNPELAAARSEASALAARAPAAGVLSDPMVSVGYENDGGPISLGTEPMTRLTFAVQQAFPFPGKLGAAEKVANADAARVAFRLERTALALAGSVRRTFADLLEARENQRLVDEQIDTWKQIDESIRSRYSAGMGTQQDVLRAQSERTRLLQQRQRDEAAEAAALVELRRLLDRPADAPMPSASRLAPDAALEVPPEAEMLGKAVEATPEIRDVAALGERSRLAADLFKRGTQPDFVVSAAYMNRGSLPLMWAAGVGVSVPLFAGSRTRPLVAEAEGLAESATTSEIALRAIARARASERLIRMRQLAAEARLDAEGVLVQDRLAVDAALASYRTGAVPFVTVLEALGTFYQDRRSAVGRLSGFLRAEADLREYALDRSAAASGLSPSTPSSGTAGM